MSIAALIAIRLSHDLTLPPRNAVEVPVRREERLLDGSRTPGRGPGPSARSARTAGPGSSTTRSLNASRSPSRARSSRIRSRRWTGSSGTVVERRSSTVRGSLRTAIVRRGESSIGPRARRLGGRTGSAARCADAPRSVGYDARSRAEVAEWQTRRSQTPLRATSSGFESRLRHQCSNTRSANARPPAGTRTGPRSGDLASSRSCPPRSRRTAGEPIFEHSRATTTL